MSSCRCAIRIPWRETKNVRNERTKVIATVQFLSVVFKSTSRRMNTQLTGVPEFMCLKNCAFGFATVVHGKDPQAVTLSFYNSGRSPFPSLMVKAEGAWAQVQRSARTHDLHAMAVGLEPFYEADSSFALRNAPRPSPAVSLWQFTQCCSRSRCLFLA